MRFVALLASFVTPHVADIGERTVALPCEPHLADLPGHCSDQQQLALRRFLLACREPGQTAQAMGPCQHLAHVAARCLACRQDLSEPLS